jgi:hypothetical protein
MMRSDESAGAGSDDSSSTGSFPAFSEVEQV